MKKFLRFFDTPALLLVLGVLAFGLQALWLGYYLDDWVFLYHIFHGGYVELSAYSFGVNRPFGAWPWWLGFSILGYAPFLWQAWSLAWRLITVLLLWQSWKQVFPGKKLEISLAAALFLVYPIFVQQTAAVTFSDHWLCFALYALSILLMIYSVQRGRLFIPLTLLALAASGLQLFTLEYFVGLEFIRPVLLWFLQRDIPGVKERLKKVARFELPYALLLGIFLAWRFRWMPTPGFDRNQPTLLTDLLHSPFKTAGDFAVKAVRDVVEALLGAWYKTYNPATMTLSPMSNRISWGLVLVAFLLCAFVFLRQNRGSTEPDTSPIRPAAWVGTNFVVMVAGFLPAWMVGQQLVSSGNYSDRFALPAMFGASLLVVSAASYLLKQKHAVLLTCVLIALAAGYHFRLANEFRWRWENQSRLAQQFAWRIPGLAPQTSIYGDGAMESGSWADIAWINFLYGRPAGPVGEDYWYYDLNKYKDGEIPQPDQALAEKRFELLSYQGNSSNSLVIQFKTVANQCLWVVTSRDENNPYLSSRVIAALPLSNPARIQPAGAANPHLAVVFPPDAAHSWCYYFEKAQLAAQQSQWSEIQTLWQALSAQKLKTGVAFEYLPFIEGVAKAGDFDTALSISAQAKSLDVAMHDPICQTWKAVFDNQPSTGPASNQKAQVVDQLDCGYLLK